MIFRNHDENARFCLKIGKNREFLPGISKRRIMFTFAFVALFTNNIRKTSVPNSFDFCLFGAVFLFLESRTRKFFR